ncbi:ABC transporter ATP-binding protein [[Eubacterium] cellulosolvens]
MIEVKSLNFSYGNGAQVLKDVNLKIEKGEFFGILGPNGSGKTTFLRCLENTVEVPEGCIFINRVDVNKIERKDLAKTIATVAQETQFAFDFTVEEVVAMGRYPYMNRLEFERPEHAKITRRIMKKTKVWRFRGKVLNHLSGGEKQRVMIARALVQEPSVLLLDEPTKDLDIHYSLELMDMIKERNRREGLTVVGIFHDLDLAARYSDRVMMLKAGRPYAVGPINAVITRENISEVFGVSVKIRRGIGKTRGLHVEVLGRV